MSEELKPCPFCGEPGGIWYINTPSGDMVACNNAVCPMCQQALFRVRDWNTRPVEDTLRAELEKADDIIFALANINDALWDTVDLPLLFKKAAGYRNMREGRKVKVILT